jgi:hypothetical protein
VHRGSERGASLRGQGHEAPLTALAEDALPVLAEPVDNDELLLDAEGVAVLLTDVVVMSVVDVAVVVPTCVYAATAASAATATVPTAADVVVSFRRRRSARSRSATVIRRFGDFVGSFMEPSLARLSWFRTREG